MEPAFIAVGRDELQRRRWDPRGGRRRLGETAAIAAHENAATDHDDAEAHDDHLSSTLDHDVHDDDHAAHDNGAAEVPVARRSGLHP